MRSVARSVRVRRWIGAAVFLLSGSIAGSKMSIAAPETGGQLAQKAKLSEVLVQNAVRPKMLLYEVVLNKMTWTVSLAYAPPVHQFYNHITEIWTSPDGKTYKKNIGTGLVDAVQVEGVRYLATNTLYLKFKSWGGETLGPFRYALPFNRKAHADVKSFFVQKNAHRFAQCAAGSRHSPPRCWLERTGNSFSTYPALIERLDFSFDREGKGRTRIPLSEAGISDPLDENRWQAFFRSIRIRPPGGARWFYFRVVYRDGTASPVLTVPVQ